MPVTADRGEIMHLAGRRRLSPALRDGAPALVADAAGRCGWAEFFAALEARGLAVSWEDAPDGAVSVVGRGAPSASASRPSRPSPLARVRAALEEARRFSAALRGRPPAP